MYSTCSKILVSSILLLLASCGGSDTSGGGFTPNPLLTQSYDTETKPVTELPDGTYELQGMAMRIESNFTNDENQTKKQGIVYISSEGIDDPEMDHTEGDQSYWFRYLYRYSGSIQKNSASLDYLNTYQEVINFNSGEFRVNEISEGNQMLVSPSKSFADGQEVDGEYKNYSSYFVTEDNPNLYVLVYQKNIDVGDGSNMHGVYIYERVGEAPPAPSPTPTPTEVPEERVYDDEDPSERSNNSETPINTDRPKVSDKEAPPTKPVTELESTNKALEKMLDYGLLINNDSWVLVEPRKNYRETHHALASRWINSESVPVIEDISAIKISTLDWMRSVKERNYQSASFYPLSGLPSSIDYKQYYKHNTLAEQTEAMIRFNEETRTISFTITSSGKKLSHDVYRCDDNNCINLNNDIASAFKGLRKLQYLIQAVLLRSVEFSAKDIPYKADGISLFKDDVEKFNSLIAEVIPHAQFDIAKLMTTDKKVAQIFSKKNEDLKNAIEAICEKRLNKYLQVGGYQCAFDYLKDKIVVTEIESADEISEKKNSTEVDADEKAEEKENRKESSLSKEKRENLVRSTNDYLKSSIRTESVLNGSKVESVEQERLESLGKDELSTMLEKNEKLLALHEAELKTLKALIAHLSNLSEDEITELSQDSNENKENTYVIDIAVLRTREQELKKSISTIKKNIEAVKNQISQIKKEEEAGEQVKLKAKENQILKFNELYLQTEKKIRQGAVLRSFWTEIKSIDQRKQVDERIQVNEMTLDLIKTADSQLNDLEKFIRELPPGHSIILDKLREDELSLAVLLERKRYLKEQENQVLEINKESVEIAQFISNYGQSTQMTDRVKQFRDKSLDIVQIPSASELKEAETILVSIQKYSHLVNSSSNESSNILRLLRQLFNYLALSIEENTTPIEYSNLLRLYKENVVPLSPVDESAKAAIYLEQNQSIIERCFELHQRVFGQIEEGKKK